MSVLSNVEVVCWTLGKGDDAPLVSGVKAALLAHGLNPERVPEISEQTAFTRACGSLKGKELAVDFFQSKKHGGKVAQFSTLYEDEDGDLRRTFRARYKLGDNGAPQCLKGQEIPQLAAAFAAAKITCIWNDVSKTIQSVLCNEGLGAYSLRPSGGVYVVPIRPSAKDLLDKLTHFAESLSSRFLRYPVPDLSSQREEIAEVVAASYAADLNAHDLAIAAYSEVSGSKVVENRREALAHTASLLAGVRDLLNGRYDGLMQRIASANAALDAVQARVNAHNEAQQKAREEAQAAAKQKAKLAGGRAIAGIKAKPATDATSESAPQAATQLTLFGQAS